MAMEAQRRQEVADRIRELRGQVPQPVIANRVGVTLRAYQAWEAGGGIGWENLVRLAGVLGVSEEYLLYGDDGDERRVGTRVETIERAQSRIEAKLDEILRHLGIEITLPDDVEPSAAARAARAAERLAERERQARDGDREDQPGRGARRASR